MAVSPLLIYTLSQAFASPLPADPYERLTQVAGPTTTQDTSANMAMETRKAKMEANFRGRYLLVPKAIMHPFFFDPDTDESANVYEQSRIQAYAIGAEYV